MNKKVTGDYIKGLRGSEHQDDFAKKIKISQPRLSKLERGLVPISFDVAYNIHRYLDIEANEIFNIYGKALTKKEKKNVQKEEKTRGVSGTNGGRTSKKGRRSGSSERGTGGRNSKNGRGKRKQGSGSKKS